MKINWLCPKSSKPVGGIKILYQHARICQEIMAETSHGSVIVHPNTVSYRPWWFDFQTEIERPWFRLQWDKKPALTNIAARFNPERDFVVIPELWVRKYGHQCARLGIPFAIYVQGGYLINKGEPRLLDLSYSAASYVLAISDDTAECVATAFPFAANKIQRIHYSIDHNKYHPKGKKRNLITYMPRKLPDQIKKLLFFLRHHLPAHWDLMPIDGLDEDQVALHLSQSRIFLSFSYLEGCPLPPLEAAFAGNYVIGYTGQGGKEYWDPEIFFEIEHGNLLQFTRSIIEKIGELEKNIDHFPTENLINLSKKYSAHQERADLEHFLRKIGLYVA